MPHDVAPKIQAAVANLRARAAIGALLAHDAWNESDHPRGQPKNAGQFATSASSLYGMKPSKMAPGISTGTFSGAERAAISEYQAGYVNSQVGGYTNIQKMLRDGVPDYPDAWNDEKGTALLNDLKKAFSNSVVTTSMTVYRGERATRKHQKLLNVVAGDIVVDSGITSTTMNPKLVAKFSKSLNPGDKPVSMEIRLQPGTHALPIDDAVGKIGEREIALAPETKLKVVSKRSTPTGIKLVLESVPSLARDAAQFEEVKHPRGKGGKFVKKSEAAGGIVKPLFAHGFKVQKGQEHAVYEAGGHKIGITGAGFPAWGWHDLTSGATGEGSASLKKHLTETLKLKPKDKVVQVQAKIDQAVAALTGKAPAAESIKLAAPGTPTPGAVPAMAAAAAPPEPAKPTPTAWAFKHPKPQIQKLLEGAGATPIKTSGSLQYYKLADGKILKIKSTPLKNGSYKYGTAVAGTPLGQISTDYKGNGSFDGGLSVAIHKSNPGTPNALPPGANSEATTGQPDYNDALFNEPKTVHIFEGSTATTENGAKYKDLKLVLSDTTDAWKINGKQKFSWTDDYSSYYGTIAQGFGQESLNAAFEALHPRGAGGQFVAKPGSFDPTSNEKDATAFGEILVAAGFEADPAINENKAKPTSFINAGKTFEINIAPLDEPAGSWFVANAQTGEIVKEGTTYASLYNDFLLPKVQPKKIVAPSAKPTLNVGSMTKVGGQLGSNPGAQYEDAEGQKYYVKDAKSIDHARNEKLAAALYNLAGAPTLQYRETDDPKRVATEWADVTGAGDPSKWTPEQRKQAQRWFAVHAWLANWDATGLVDDNQGLVNGKPTTLDVGGALKYRAQGTEKGSAFGDAVGEWTTLRDPAKNKTAAALFGPMTHQQLKESVAQLDKVSHTKLVKAINDAGYEGADLEGLVSKLSARKEDLKKKAAALGKPTALAYAPPPPVPAFNAPFELSGGPSIGSLGSQQGVTELGTSAERTSVTTYTGGTYQQINRALRYGYVSGSEHKQANNIANITAWLDRTSFPEEAVCSRRVSGDYGDFLLENTSIGAEFTDLGFTSTSRTGQWSGSVTMLIKIPKGARAASVKQLSHHPGEDEVLIQRGTTYKVVAYDQKKKTLYCEMHQEHMVQLKEGELLNAA